jgi:hypothetical protein
MKNFDENELIDKAMAGRLDADEQRLWAALLAERPDLETDLEIGKALRAMPPPPTVASNFTALVLQSISAPETRPHSATGSWLIWFRLPRLVRIGGLAAVVLGLSVSPIYYQRVQKQKVAASVKSFAGGLNLVAVKPDTQPDRIVNVLQDFEAIRRLPGDVDEQLLTALTEQ